MAHPVQHAESSVRRFGGRVEDYLPLHNWFDASKAHYPDIRHRLLRHHSQGIFWAEEVFGPVVTLADGRQIPTRFIGEQHVREDLGKIPTLADWCNSVRLQGWMLNRKETVRDRDDQPLRV